MDNSQVRDRSFERTAWVAFCVWWEIAETFEFLFSATWMLGFGLIFIALNVARVLKGSPASGFTVAAGTLASLWGGLEVAGSRLDLRFELPVIPIVVTVLGIMVFRGTVAGKAHQKQEA